MGLSSVFVCILVVSCFSIPFHGIFDGQNPPENAVRTYYFCRNGSKVQGTTVYTDDSFSIYRGTVVNDKVMIGQWFQGGNGKYGGFNLTWIDSFGFQGYWWVGEYKSVPQYDWPYEGYLITSEVNESDCNINDALGRTDLSGEYETGIRLCIDDQNNFLARDSQRQYYGWVNHEEGLLSGNWIDGSNRHGSVLFVATSQGFHQHLYDGYHFKNFTNNFRKQLLKSNYQNGSICKLPDYTGKYNTIWNGQWESKYLEYSDGIQYILNLNGKLYGTYRQSDGKGIKFFFTGDISSDGMSMSGNWYEANYVEIGHGKMSLSLKQDSEGYYLTGLWGFRTDNPTYNWGGKGFPDGTIRKISEFTNEDLTFSLDTSSTFTLNQRFKDARYGSPRGELYPISFCNPNNDGLTLTGVYGGENVFLKGQYFENKKLGIGVYGEKSPDGNHIIYGSFLYMSRIEKYCHGWQMRFDNFERTIVSDQMISGPFWILSDHPEESICKANSRWLPVYNNNNPGNNQSDEKEKKKKGNEGILVLAIISTSLLGYLCILFVCGSPTVILLCCVIPVLISVSGISTMYVQQHQQRLKKNQKPKFSEELTEDLNYLKVDEDNLNDL